MSNIRLIPRVRTVRGFAAIAAAGVLTVFASTAAAHADETTSAASTTSTSDSVAADALTTTATSSTAASSTSESTTAAASSSAASSSANNCPASVLITVGSITVNGGQVVVSFTHTGTECPDASPSVLHVHENLLRAPHAGSDAVQLNRDFNITPGFADSVTVPLLEAVDGKCFVQVDVHASGVNHGQFFPTATCPSESTSSSSSPSQIVNPPSPPAGGSSSSVPTKVAVTPASSPAALSGPTLASTGAHAQNPLVIGASLLLAGSMLLVAGRPSRRWRNGLRFARTLLASGRH